MKGLKVLYNFHPVGQGVFSSGMLAPEDGSNNRFWWVFDCGTHMKTHYARRDEEIENLAAMVGGASAGRRPRIDLVFISHFDKDHVNGLLKLLELFDVGRLVLPFIPLYERLLIAFPNKSAQSPRPWQLFITAPARYIQSTKGIKVDRLTIIPPSGSEGLSVETEGSPRPWGDDPVEIVPPPSELPEEINAFDNLGGAGIRIEWLAQGASLKVGNVWEFVPYNDAVTIVRATLRFRQHAKRLADLMINATREESRKKLKARIVKWYGHHHGTKSKDKNLISLFVYGGPLVKPQRVDIGKYSYSFYKKMSAHSAPSYPFWPTYYPHIQPITHTILYTGDGFLETRKQLLDMLTYFGDGRTKRPKVVQIMHHGSKSNWHPGVADALAPTFSIFCAYEHGLYYHPHTDVWSDFASYGRWVCGADVCEGFRFYQRLSI